MSAWTWKPHEHSKTFGFSSNQSGCSLIVRNDTLTNAVNFVRNLFKITTLNIQCNSSFEISIFGNCEHINKSYSLNPCGVLI